MDKEMRREGVVKSAKKYGTWLPIHGTAPVMDYMEEKIGNEQVACGQATKVEKECFILLQRAANGGWK